MLAIITFLSGILSFPVAQSFLHCIVHFRFHLSGGQSKYMLGLFLI